MNDGNVPPVDPAQAEEPKPAAEKPTAQVKPPAVPKPAAQNTAVQVTPSAAAKPAMPNPAAQAKTPAAPAPAAQVPVAPAKSSAVPKPAAQNPAVQVKPPAVPAPAARNPPVPITPPPMPVPTGRNQPTASPNLPAETQRQQLLLHEKHLTLAPLQRVPRVVRRHFGKLVFLLLPILLATIYFFLVAADMYASEARFLVRSPTRTPQAGVSGFLQTSGLMRGQDDVYSVQDFATSRDAIVALSKSVDLRAIYGREEADWIARFPNFYDEDNSEDFYRYFKRRVSVELDMTTGLLKMQVLAFRAEDAQLVATRLLEAAEELVNQLNERARTNAVKDAELQVGLAEKAVADAQAKVLAYRNREMLIDPGTTSAAMFESMSRLEEEQQSTRFRIAELGRRSPGSPLLADLRSRSAALERQIAQQRARLAGGNGSMAPRISEYEQLTLRQELAAKQFSSALTSLENARADARRQQIYLDRVVTPNLPDRALYPRRYRALFIVFVTCFLVYSIGTLLIAGVREHAQD